MSVSRDSARRISRLAQGSVVALAVGAAVVGIVSAKPLTQLPEPDPNAGPMLPPAPEVPKGPPRSPELDLPLLVGVLWEYGNPPVEDVAVATTDTPATGAATTKPPVTHTDPTGEPVHSWRYIGQIVGPRTTHALLERQGLQRLVSVGGEAEGTRVVEIHKDYVMLDDGAGPRRVQLASAANAWEMVGSSRPVPSTGPASLGGVTRPPGYSQPGRTGAQPMRPPPAVPQARPGQSTDEMDEMRLKMEELRRQREESGEVGAAEPADDGAARRVAFAAAAAGGSAG